MNTETDTATATAEPTADATTATGSPESDASESGKRSYVRYNPETQAGILARAGVIGAREAAKESGVPYGTLLRWQKKAANPDAPATAPKRGRGRPRKVSNDPLPPFTPSLTSSAPLPLGPRTVAAVIGYPPDAPALNQVEQLAADLITQTLGSLSKGSSTRVLSLLTFLKT